MSQRSVHRHYKSSRQNPRPGPHPVELLVSESQDRLPAATGPPKALLSQRLLTAQSAEALSEGAAELGRHRVVQERIDGAGTGDDILLRQEGRQRQMKHKQKIVFAGVFS